jgi:hypothetical protein
MALLDAAMAARRWSQNKTEDILGLARGSIGHFRGDRRPGVLAQEAFERVLGVPRAAWWTDDEHILLSLAEQRAARLQVPSDDTTQPSNASTQDKSAKEKG